MNSSTKKPLKQSVKDHLDDVTLSKDQLSRLDALMADNTESSKQTRLYFNRWSVAATAMFLCLTVMVMMFISNQPSNIPQSIAQEVVHNHLKLKPLEVKTDSIAAVSKYFSKLDFMPINSSMLLNTDQSLLGGRYCSLQGITAAQLRLKDNQSSSVQTFYQTEYRQNVFGELPDIDKGDKPIEIYVNGVKVKIWREKGLVLAITDTP